MTYFEPPNNWLIAGIHLEIDRLRHELRHTYKTMPFNDPQRSITIHALLLKIQGCEVDIARLSGSNDTRKHRHPLADMYDLQWSYH